MPSKRRVAIRQGIEDEDLRRLANNLGWQLLAEDLGDESSERSPEIVWEVPSRGVHVHALEEFIGYLVVKGEDQQAVDTFAEELEQQHDAFFHNREEILDVWEEVLDNDDDEAAVAAILYVGLVAPERCNERYMDVFREALQREDEDVRVNTFDAMAYPKWPELRALAEHARQEDSSERVRWKANRLLEAWEHFGWPK